MRLETVKVEDIEAPLLEPRFVLDSPELDELAASMARIGLVQPIVVVANGDSYRLVAGNRRLAAATRLGWTAFAGLVQYLDVAGGVDGVVADSL